MKGKKIISLMLALAVVSTMILGVPAFATDLSKDAEALAAVYDYVEAMDSQDWALPNEWGPSWEAESLKAGAQCVKMVIWSLIVDPWYANLGFDMKNNNDGSYWPNTEQASCTQAINAVGGIGMESSDGNIFYASYRAGNKDSYGDKHIGRCLQWGSQKHAQDGRDYFYILDYYYSYSGKSTGAIQEFTY